MATLLAFCCESYVGELTLRIALLPSPFCPLQQVYKDVKPKIELMSTCEPSASSVYAADLHSRTAAGIAAIRQGAADR